MDHQLFHAKPRAGDCSSSFLANIEHILLSGGVLPHDGPSARAGEGDNLVRSDHVVEDMFVYFRLQKISPDYFNHGAPPVV